MVNMLKTNGKVGNVQDHMTNKSRKMTNIRKNRTHTKT